MKTAWPCRFLMGLCGALAVHALSAQETDDHSPWSVSLYGGAALPAGGFATMPEQEGYQSHYGLSGRPLPGPVFGSMVAYGLSPSVVGMLEANYARMAAGDLGEKELFPPAYRGGLGGGAIRRGYGQEQGEWEAVQLLGGLGLRGERGRFSFTLHVTAGAQWTRSPAVEVCEHGTTWNLADPDYGTYSTCTVQRSAAAWSPVFGGGAGLAVAVGKRFAVRLGAAFHHARVNFSYVQEVASRSQRNDGTEVHGYALTRSAEVRQPFTAYRATLGLTYRFPSWY